jgi:hypothetical protein
MSGAVKGVLIVGGVAVAAFVVARAVAAPPMVSTSRPQPTDAAAISGLITSGLNLFTQLTRPPPQPDYNAIANSPGVSDYNAQPGEQVGIYGIDWR